MDDEANNWLWIILNEDSSFTTQLTDREHLGTDSTSGYVHWP
jgi:hypothetical protein